MKGWVILKETLQNCDHNAEPKTVRKNHDFNSPSWLKARFVFWEVWLRVVWTMTTQLLCLSQGFSSLSFLSGMEWHCISFFDDASLRYLAMKTLFPMAENLIIIFCVILRQPIVKCCRQVPGFEPAILWSQARWHGNVPQQHLFIKVLLLLTTFRIFSKLCWPNWCLLWTNDSQFTLWHSNHHNVIRQWV